MRLRTRQLARIGLFAGLSVVGSFLQIPSPVSTVAFDSFAGFLSALLFGPAEGAAVIFIGHLATSSVHGFPLGILHVPIALGLALDAYLVGLLNSRGRFFFVPAAALGVAINTLLFVLAVPVLGWESSVAFVPFLFVASAANVLLASFLYVAVRSRLLPHAKDDGIQENRQR